MGVQAVSAQVSSPSNDMRLTGQSLPNRGPGLCEQETDTVAMDSCTPTIEGDRIPRDADGLVDLAALEEPQPVRESRPRRGLHAQNDPTPEEIARRAAEVRRDWDESTELSRYYASRSIPGRKDKPCRHRMRVCRLGVDLPRDVRSVM